MMSLPLRCSRFMMGLVLVGALAPAVSAREPTLMETLQAVTESMHEMSDASVRAAQAQAEYDAQLELVRDAARGLAEVFAAVEAPQPSTAIIDSLLSFPEQAKPLTRLQELLVFAKPATKKLTPVLPGQLVIDRAADPNGTSIYDSLSFGP